MAHLTAEAKLDLPENAEERIAVVKHLLEMTKLFEENLEKQRAKGFGSKGDGLEDPPPNSALRGVLAIYGG